eukprot:gene6227-2845_t
MGIWEPLHESNSSKLVVPMILIALHLYSMSFFYCLAVIHSNTTETVHGDLGTIARVQFQFISRPEWLKEGSRVIVRDLADGLVAGAGFIGLRQVAAD